MNVCCAPPVMADESVARIVDALRDPACYPPPVRRIKVIDTQLATHEPLATDELPFTLPVDAHGNVPAGADERTSALLAGIKC